MSENEQVTVTETGSIATDGAHAVLTGDNSTLHNEGKISAQMPYVGVYNFGGTSFTALVNGEEAEIKGGMGVRNDGVGSVIEKISNGGDIIGTHGPGVSNASTIMELLNSGTIEGNAGFSPGIENTGHIGRIENSGVISGSGVAIYNLGGANIDTFDNSGELISEDGGSITNSGTVSTLRNRSGGKIVSENNSAIYNYGGITKIINEGLISAGVDALVHEDGTIGEIRNSGTIRSTDPNGYAFRNAGTGTVTGGLINTGRLEGRVELGSATLYLEGPKGAVTGEVSGGTDSAVVVGGQFTTQAGFFVDRFSVKEGGRLTIRNGHTIEVHKDAFENEGTVDVLAGETAYISGNYRQSSGAALRIGASSASEHGKLQVKGTASFEQGTALTVAVSETNALANQNVMASVIEAGSLEAGNETFLVDDDSELFDFEASVNGDNTVDLVTILDKDSDDDGNGNGDNGGADGGDGGGGSKGGAVSNRVIAQGFDQGLGAARVLDGFVAGANNTGDIASVVTAFGRLGSQQEVADAVAQTLPLMSANLNQVSLGSMQSVNRVIQARQDGLAGSSGMSSGDGFVADKNLWFKPLASYADQDDRDGIAGYRVSTYGFVFGGDAVVGKSSRLGLAFSYARSDVDGKSTARSNSADIDAYQLIAYGSHSISAWPDVEVNWQADVGMNRNDGQRIIRFGGLSRTAESDFDSTTAHLGAGISKGFQLGEKTRITPSLRTDYFRLRNESYTETGAQGLNLRVRSQTSEQWFAMLESRLQHQLTERAAVSVNLGVGYEMLGESNGITSSYVGGGAAFRTPGMEPGRWLGRAGLGLAMHANERTEITARYDLEGRDGFLAQTASVNVRWAF